MDVAFIDPWGVNGAERYLNGEIKGLSRYCSITLFTNFYYSKMEDVDYEVEKCFFKYSQKMKGGFPRTIIRGLEYYYAYKRVVYRKLKDKKYDIVHINWLLLYPIDYLFIKRIRKLCKKIVYTAHNVIPHVNGEKHIPSLRKIYSSVDDIIIHGEEIKNEFQSFFPSVDTRLHISRHGADLDSDTTYNPAIVDVNLQRIVYNAKLVFTFFGNIIYNKGADRLVGKDVIE